MIDTLAIPRSYLRKYKKFPTVWCAGCGLGIIQGAILMAIDKLNIPRDKIVLVSGIGCTGRMPTYLDFNTIHVTHGRALPCATGIKMANPELQVFAIMGDGDAAAIGGNHLIHTARRNIDINAVIVNNYIYGMTGGQYSPTAPLESVASTAPYGNLEPPFNLSELMVAAGASFVARTTAYHTARMISLMTRAIQKKGFSAVEIVSNCHTTYGRRNKMRSAVAMMRWLKESTLDIKQWDRVSEEQREGKIKTGIFCDVEKPEYSEQYNKIIQMAQKRVEEPAPEKEKKRVLSREEMPERMERVNVRLSGTGGQGLMLAGVIYGSAAAIYDNKNAVQTQSYGPEARGSASKSDVVISDGPIDYPEAEKLDLLLCLSQEACDKYYKDLKEEGTLIVDTLYVTNPPTSRVYSIHFTEIARNIVGRALVANVVALGAISVLTPFVSRKALQSALLDRAPKGTEELNLKALNEGVKAAEELLKKR